MFSRRSRTDKHRKLSKIEMDQLVQETTNILANKEFVLDPIRNRRDIEFEQDGIFYCIYLHLLPLQGEPMLYEYRIHRSNNKEFLKWKGCMGLKSTLREFLENITTENVWYDSYWYEQIENKPDSINGYKQSEYYLKYNNIALLK